MITLLALALAVLGLLSPVSAADYTKIQLRRGPESNRTNTTFDIAEPAWTTNTHKLWIGDGATKGGLGVAMDADLLALDLSLRAWAGGLFTPIGSVPAGLLTNVGTTTPDLLTVARNGSNATVSITDPNLTNFGTWLSGRGLFDAYGSAAAQMNNLSNTVFNFGFLTAGSNALWIADAVAQQQNLSNAVFNFGFLTVGSNFLWIADATLAASNIVGSAVGTAPLAIVTWGDPAVITGYGNDVSYSPPDTVVCTSAHFLSEVSVGQLLSTIGPGAESVVGVVTSVLDDHTLTVALLNPGAFGSPSGLTVSSPILHGNGAQLTGLSYTNLADRPSLNYDPLGTAATQMLNLSNTISGRGYLTIGSNWLWDAPGAAATVQSNVNAIWNNSTNNFMAGSLTLNGGTNKYGVQFSIGSDATANCRFMIQERAMLLYNSAAGMLDIVGGSGKGVALFVNAGSMNITNGLPVFYANTNAQVWFGANAASPVNGFVSPYQIVATGTVAVGGLVFSNAGSSVTTTQNTAATTPIAGTNIVMVGSTIHFTGAPWRRVTRVALGVVTNNYDVPITVLPAARAVLLHGLFPGYTNAAAAGDLLVGMNRDTSGNKYQNWGFVFNRSAFHNSYGAAWTAGLSLTINNGTYMVSSNGWDGDVWLELRPNTFGNFTRANWEFRFSDQTGVNLGQTMLGGGYYNVTATVTNANFITSNAANWNSNAFVDVFALD